MSLNYWDCETPLQKEPNWPERKGWVWKVTSRYVVSSSVTYGMECLECLEGSWVELRLWMRGIYRVLEYWAVFYVCLELISWSSLPCD